MKTPITIYSIYIIGLVLGLLLTFGLIKEFSYEQYGQYTLFLTYNSFLIFFTLGFPSGLFLKYRTKKIENAIFSIRRELIFFIFFQVIVSIFLIICSFLFHNNIFFLSAIAMFPNNMALFYKNIFLSTSKLYHYYIFDLLNKFLYLLSFLFIVCFDLGFNIYMFIYILCMYFVAILFLFILLTIKGGKSEFRPNYKKTFQSGFFLFVGTWFAILYLGIDKVFLKSNPVELGIYTVAFTLVNICILCFVPIQSYILSNFDINNIKEAYFNNLSLINNIGKVISTLYILLFVPFIQYFDIREIYTNFNEAILVGALLMFVFPMMLSNNVFISSVAKIDDEKTYFNYNLMMIFIFIVFNIFYLHIISNVIFAIILALFTNYLVLNNIFIYLYSKDFKNTLKINIEYFLWVFVVIILFNLTTILSIIMSFIILAYYMYRIVPQIKKII